MLKMYQKDFFQQLGFFITITMFQLRQQVSQIIVATPLKSSKESYITAYTKILSVTYFPCLTSTYIFLHVLLVLRAAPTNSRRILSCPI